MAKARIKDMIRDAEDAVKNAPTEGDAKAKAEARLAFLKEMSEAGFTINQDHINDVVAAETQKVTDEWKGVVGCDLDETKELMDSISSEDLERLAGGTGASDGDGKDDGTKDGDPSEENVLKLMREGLSERDARIADLEGKYDASRKQNDEFQKTIMGDRIKSNLVSALKSEGLQDRYRDIAIRNSGYDDLLTKALEGDEPDGEKLKEIAEGLKKESEVWFTAPPDPNLTGIDFTPPAGDIPALTDEEREAQSASVF